MEGKKLYRSTTDKMLAGVCGGLGQYFGIDATVVRLIFALLVFFGVGSGIILYIILALIMPLEP
ncbi:MAG: PspC domain-containing protein [Anaerolineae bacterium]|jgi:phage shock protein PspC (stress-responsive transcriptional regulator)|nr:PspC domain-containing protein [Anaerolineae bacterium]